MSEKGGKNAQKSEKCLKKTTIEMFEKSEDTGII